MTVIHLYLSMAEGTMKSVDTFSDLLGEQLLEKLARSGSPEHLRRAHRVSRMAKRGLDICGALVGLVLLALLLPVIASLIWWQDRGASMASHSLCINFVV
jgi:lipopolysaccharide/colanic/teichoic acid biosynthesis glycosyltransferase